MGCRFWVVEVACGWFVANGWPKEGAGFVGMVGMVGFDETHNKWGAISGLYRLDVGGLRKEIDSEEGDMASIVRCFAVGRAGRGRRWSDLRFGGSS